MKLSTFLDRFDSIRDGGSGNLLVLCPAHSDTNPSLLVGQGTDGRILLFCRAGCSTDSVLSAMDLERRDLFGDGRPDVRRPVTAIDPDPDEPTPEDSARLAYYVVKAREHLLADTEVAAEARAYLLSRWGVDDEIAARFGIGLAPAGIWFEDYEDLTFSATYTAVSRIVVPFRNFRGTIVGLQARALGDHRVRWASPMNPPGRSWSRYASFSHDSGLGSDVIATEGPGDALVCAASGFDSFGVRGSAVASNTRLQTELVEALAGRRVIVVGDNDSAGQRFTETLAGALTAAGIDTYSIDWRFAPPTTNDLSEWFENDREGFLDSFTNAVEQAIAWDSVPVASGDEPMGTTEVAVASELRERLRLESGDDGVIFAPGPAWHVWTGRGWRQDPSAHYIRRSGQELALELEREGRDEFVEANGDPDLEAIARAKISAGLKAQRTAFLTGTLSELKPMVLVDASDLDRHVDRISCANGTVDLRTGELRPHDPRDYITNVLAVDYDPSAECPRWERFLRECHPDHPDEMAAYLQRVVGYSLLGNPENLIFLHVGAGGNGKSTFVETIGHVLKSVTVVVPFGTFENRSSGQIPNDLAMLNGARLCVATEGSANRPLDEAILKRVTGRDTIVARFLRQEFFSFEPRFSVHLQTNHAPVWTSQSEGLWRRVKNLAWKRRILPHEMDTTLPDALRAEEAGILRWIIDGAIEYHARGLQEPACVTDSTTNYKDSSDPLGTFLSNIVVEERGARSSAPLLYQRFRDHQLDVEGQREGDILSAKRFYAELRDKGFASSRGRMGGKIVMIFSGLRLKTTDEMIADLEGDEVPSTNTPIGIPLEV